MHEYDVIKTNQKCSLAIQERYGYGEKRKKYRSPEYNLEGMQIYIPLCAFVKMLKKLYRKNTSFQVAFAMH
jgi:hypothetical protein